MYKLFFPYILGTLGRYRGKAFAGKDARYWIRSRPDRLEPHDGSSCWESRFEQDKIY